MESHISATEAARNFSDLINRVRYRGEEFVIERRGEPVCRVVPAAPRRFTVGDMVRLLGSLPKPDPGFWDDVERFQKNQKPRVPKSVWRS